jgi:small subunit ribosomal protein S6
MRNYELMFIVHPDLDDGDLQDAIANVAGLVERNGGQVTNVDPLGVKRLAYPIQDVREGLYVLMLLELDPATVAECERGLHLMDGVIRHLLVRVD